MNRKQQKRLFAIASAAGMLAVLHFLPVTGWVRFLLYLLPYWVVGHDILKKAWKGIRNRQVFDENFLMAIATVGALALGATVTGDYVEAVAVMLFYQVGELFQSYAVGKSRKSIAGLMDIRPDYVNLEEDGKLVQADPEEIPVGTVIVVQPGERVPIDGIVLEGCSSLNTSALTGESMPRDVQSGRSVISGCINMNGVLKVRTTKDFADSTVSRVLELVENAGARKSRSEHFIARFARIYTPAVCICALAVTVLPPVIRLLLGMEGLWGQWLYRGLSFLVASCPCALVISIPLTFFAGIGGASREGILIKGSNYLEVLAQTGCVAFDKTGTLTHGTFEVTAAEPAQGFTKEQLMKYAAYAECSSSHPIGVSLLRAYGKELDRSRVSRVQEHSGMGITAQVDGTAVAVGTPALMPRGVKPVAAAGTVVHVALGGVYAGHILISDKLKPNAKYAIEKLAAVGVKKTCLLSGDREESAQAVAKELGIDRCFAQLLPGDKVAKVEELLAEKDLGKALAFVGDGINDAPVLARADIGIAMGALGSDAAIEAADIVLMDDDPEKLPKAIRIARKCMGIVKQNTVLAIGIKVAALALVAVGQANMWMAIFADVGVMVLAVLNAIRAMFVKRT